MPRLQAPIRSPLAPIPLPHAPRTAVRSRPRVAQAFWLPNCYLAPTDRPSAPRPQEPAARDLTRWVREDAQRVADGTLSSRAAAFYWPSTRGDTKGVVLMLHGYSAGPWQYHSEAQRLNTAGLDVFCAPLAGHGALNGDALSADALPKAGETKRHLAAAESMYQAAAQHAEKAGVPLHVYGLSLGGALAIQIARDHADRVKRLVVIAPILHPAKREASLFYQAAHAAAMTRPGRALLNHATMGWGALPPSPNWPGHWNFSMGNLLAALEVGQQVVHDKRPLPMPTQLVISDFDETCAPESTRTFFAQVAQDCAIMTFGKTAQVIHPMVSAIENIDRGSRMVLDEATTRFLAEGVQDRSTYCEPPQSVDLHPEQPLRRALAGRDTAMQAPQSRDQV